jgi:2,3-bisphosphoglycerate-independent phosphoglycerate mutase
MIKKNVKRLILVIFDGFGFSIEKKGNAVFHAKMPTLKDLMAEYPWTTLEASGAAVGLLSGFAGNSEVGHLTIGAGRIVPSPLKRMHDLIASGGLEQHQVWQLFLRQIVEQDKALHFLGLLSDGGVHSHEEHLYALMRSAVKAGVKKIYLHAWLDGRDVAPRSAGLYLERLEAVCQELGVGKIVSAVGRLYAMDRDKHYDRTDRVVSLLTEKNNQLITSWQTMLEQEYALGRDDQYMLPHLFDQAGRITVDDGLCFFNFRPERMQQIVERLCSVNAGAHQNIGAMSATAYFDPSPSWAPVPLLEPIVVQKGLLQMIEAHAAQENFEYATIAESEKKAHVGYYLHGNNQKILPHERQIIIPSIKHDSYAQNPAMSAAAVTDAVLEQWKDEQIHIIVVNYANADMVGHSGDFEAAIKACEILDQQLRRLSCAVLEHGGTLLLTADHGNVEEMLNLQTGQKNSSHSNNPVLFLFVDDANKGACFESRQQGLSSIAPTIIDFSGWNVDDAMDEGLKMMKK